MWCDAPVCPARAAVAVAARQPGRTRQQEPALRGRVPARRQRGGGAECGRHPCSAARSTSQSHLAAHASGAGGRRLGDGSRPAGIPAARPVRHPVSPGSACVRRRSARLGDGPRPAGIPAARPVRHPVSPGSACVRRRLGDGPRPAGIPAARPVRHPVSPGSACVRRRRAPDKRMRYQPMYWPPLIARLAPVIQHARSSAKKPTAKAISSGSPRRPTGICATILLRTSSGTAITMSVPT